jgi:predicted DNA-binding transcriptional regulator YafY
MRDDLRTFRVDRMRRPTISKEPAVEPPQGFEAVAYVSRSLARTPWRHDVVVLLHLPLEEATRRLPATIAELVEADGGTLLGMRVSSLEWMASVLAGIGCSFTVREPEELRTSVRMLAERLAASAQPPR